MLEFIDANNKWPKVESDVELIAQLKFDSGLDDLSYLGHLFLGHMGQQVKQKIWMILFVILSNIAATNMVLLENINLIK